MKPVLTNTFFRFFFGFLAIIGVAFGVLIVTGSQAPKVDTVAAPK